MRETRSWSIKLSLFVSLAFISFLSFAHSTNVSQVDSFDLVFAEAIGLLDVEVEMKITSDLSNDETILSKTAVSSEATTDSVGVSFIGAGSNVLKVAYLDKAFRCGKDEVGWRV